MTPPVASVVFCGLLLAGSALGSGANTVEPAEQRVALLAVAVAGAYTAGRLLPRPAAAGYGFAVALGTGTLVVLTPDGMSGAALAGPLGYGNANGALCAQGAAAALIPAVACRRGLTRAAALVVAAALVLLAWQTGSRAATAAAFACVLAALAVCLIRPPQARVRRASRAVVVGAGAVSAAVLALTVALGVAYNPATAREGSVDRLIDRTLSERRVVLWSESLDLLMRNPAAGVGLGRFAAASPTARADDDARWAHSAFLQYGAEAGFPGLVALLALSAAPYLALWRAAPDRLAVVGASAAAAALTQAAVDYVFHFPVIPLLTALTVGACAQRRPRPLAENALPADVSA